MTLPQIVSLVSTIVLTAVATVIGVQIILLLKEVKHALTKVNQVVDITESTVRHVARPVGSFVAMLEGLKESSRFVDAFSSFVKRHSAPTPPVDADGKNHPVPPHFDY